MQSFTSRVELYQKGKLPQMYAIDPGCPRAYRTPTSKCNAYSSVASAAGSFHPQPRKEHTCTHA
jgi:hypothetical protein